MDGEARGLLEPYDSKGASPVLRGEEDSDVFFPPDPYFSVYSFSIKELSERGDIP
jgi:hypothetical protein